MAEDGARNLRGVEGSEGSSENRIEDYLGTLSGRSASTVDAYGRILRQFASWVAERPGGSDGFRPELLTRAAVEENVHE